MKKMKKLKAKTLV